MSVGDIYYKRIKPGTFPSTWYWAGGGNGPSYAPDSFYAKAVSVAADRYTLLSPSAMQINIGTNSYVLSAQATLDLSVTGTWDTISGTNYTTAANRAGKDFYTYAVQPTSGIAPAFVVSANATTPSGYSGSTSRKVGGFHCLCASMSTPGTWASNHAYALGATILSGSYWYRCAIAGTSTNGSMPTLTTTVNGTTVDSGVTWMCENIHPASGYVAGDIIPNSVWDLKHYSISGNAGMAYISLTDEWHDIYIASGGLGTTASVYQATPMYNTTWNETVDNAASVKKYLLRDYNSQVSAEGSNQQTNVSTSTQIPPGGNSDTAGRRMISNYFLEDCAGLYWLWLDEQSFQPGTGAAGWKTTVTENKGQLYLIADNADVKLFAGGSWYSGAYCGSRARFATDCRWRVYSYFAARLAARAIHK